MKIAYIRPQELGGVTRIGVKDDNGEMLSYSVLDKHFDISPFKIGDSLTDDGLSRLKREDERYRATRVALRLLSAGECSKRGLYIKLISRGISDECARQVCEYVISLGYIKEREQITNLILSLAGRDLYGERKILAKLHSRHYNTREVREIMYSLIDRGEIDFRENAKRLIEKKLPDTATDGEIAKLLYKYGYSLSGIEND